MAQSAYVNVTDGDVNIDALGPRNAYAAPNGDAPYTDEAGGNYAAKLGEAFGPGTDSYRLGTAQRRDFYPNARYSPERGFYAARDADDAARHSVESVDADGWTEQKGQPPRFAPNPRSAIVEEPRPTSRLAPRSYTFLRPFSQEVKRRFTGDHFSMADHRREYETHGMAPVRSGRNTYRIEPRPWDENVVDVAPDPTPQFNGKITAIEIAPAGNRNYRLGG